MNQKESGKFTYFKEPFFKTNQATIYQFNSKCSLQNIIFSNF